ncbi:hypothetical protein O9X98_14995 [Agrobacterium salinitolerans]|nr:hypothetical protein [Agrobacterium salinitolerans]
MASRLTTRRLDAIVEALVFRTAGEIEGEDDGDLPQREDYEAALEWALSELDRRKIAAILRRA